MKSIENLTGIRLKGQPLLTPKNDIVIEDGDTRVPLLFLVDISDSMKSALPTINETLTTLMQDICNSEGEVKYIVDFSIITFGGNGVVVAREFDLLKKDEVFQIVECKGMTPLGEAMLQAYHYGFKRKQMYKKEGLTNYNQPTVVLITDFQENNSPDVVIDNRNIEGNSLYYAMAELYTEAFSETLKQFTYSIPLGSVDAEKSNKLKVAKVNDGNVDIARALIRVVSEYTASVAQVTETNVLEMVAALSEDSTEEIVVDDSIRVEDWQRKQRAKYNIFDEED